MLWTVKKIVKIYKRNMYVRANKTVQNRTYDVLTYDVFCGTDDKGALASSAIGRTIIYHNFSPLQLFIGLISVTFFVISLLVKCILLQRLYFLAPMESVSNFPNISRVNWKSEISCPKSWYNIHPYIRAAPIIYENR